MITRAHIRRQLRKDGGIMSAAPRQGYFLGGVTRAIGKAVGKVGDVVGEITKSDLGRAALLGLGAYATRNMGPIGEAGGWKKFIMGAPGIPMGPEGKFYTSPATPNILSRMIGGIGLNKATALGAGALATGAMLAAPSGEDAKTLSMLKERGGDVEAYLRQYYKDYFKANWQKGWTQEGEDEFVAANTPEYSKGGRVGLYGGGDPETMDETLSPFQIMQDQGIPYSIPVDAGAKSITKEGVQMAGGPYNQGSDVKNALAVWNNMGPRDREMFEGFLDFFRSGIWKDQIQGLRIQEENRKMASAPDPQDMMNDFAMEQFGKPLHELTPKQLEMLYDMANDQAALPQEEAPVAAAKGGRIKYGIGDLVKGRSKMVLKDFFNDEEEYAQGGRIGYKEGSKKTGIKGLLEKIGENIRYKFDDFVYGEPATIGYSAGNYDPEILRDPEKRAIIREKYDTLSQEKQEYIEMYLDSIAYPDDEQYSEWLYKKPGKIKFPTDEKMKKHNEQFAQGGRIGKYLGGMGLPGIPRMAADGLEYDMSQHGGFQPLGAQEGKDDVKANLAKNEFVMTADAVRGAGDGDIELGAQKMYDTMKRLENKVA